MSIILLLILLLPSIFPEPEIITEPPFPTKETIKRLHIKSVKVYNFELNVYTYDINNKNMDKHLYLIYDSNGNPIYANGKMTDIDYLMDFYQLNYFDERGNEIESKTYKISKDTVPYLFIRRRFDNNNNMIEYQEKYSPDDTIAFTDFNGKWWYSYKIDSLNRIIYSKQIQIHNNDTVNIVYTFNKYGNNNKIIEEKVTTKDKSYLTTYDYDSLNRLEHVSYIDGDYREYQYNVSDHSIEEVCYRENSFDGCIIYYYDTLNRIVKKLYYSDIGLSTQDIWGYGDNNLLSESIYYNYNKDSTCFEIEEQNLKDDTIPSPGNYIINNSLLVVAQRPIVKRERNIRYLDYHVLPNYKFFIYKYYDK